MSSSSIFHVVAASIVGAFLLAGRLPADDQVAVVVDADAPALEKFAAQELASQFKRLFDAEVTVTTQLPEAHDNLVVIGSPASSRAVKEITAGQWPELSEQGFVLRSFSRQPRQGLIVGGATPVATLWAAYELGHRFGVRYVLRGDIYPNTPGPLKLDGLDLVLEPELRTRTWRTINDFAIGPESWGIADHRKLLGQLAKLKFNRVMLSVYPWQPFVDYEFRGVNKQTALLWYGQRYQIDRDGPGRTALGQAREFTNPDFAGASSYDEMTQAGIRHARGIIQAANKLGMSVGISISPLEFPREFTAALPGLETSRGLENLLVAPGAKLQPDDPQLAELVATKIRAYLRTYPHVDTLYLTLPEFPEWSQHAEPAWQQLTSGLDAAPSLTELVESARGRALIASGDRGQRAVQGNVTTLAFLKRLLADSELLLRPDGSRVDLVITAADPALYPILDRVLPPGAATLNFVDYTARRVAEQIKLLAEVPADKTRSRLILTLADDNVGVLSQSATRSLDTLLGALRAHGWDGFSTRYWMLAELDPTVYFLSRAAWDAELTARGAHDDLFTTITGKQSVADRLWLGFGHIEEATELTDRQDIGYAFPVPGMLMKHYQAAPLPQWWEEQTEHYTEAMIELYRSRDAAHPRSQPLLYYYARRSEYVLDYLNCVKAVRQAAIAKDRGNREEAITQLETAIEALYNAIDAVADVAQDQSDRGLVAVLNAYAYRPLVAEYERLLDEE